MSYWEMVEFLNQIFLLPSVCKLLHWFYCILTVVPQYPFSPFYIVNKPSTNIWVHGCPEERLHSPPSIAVRCESFFPLERGQKLCGQLPGDTCKGKESALTSFFSFPTGGSTHVVMCHFVLHLVLGTKATPSEKKRKRGAGPHVFSEQSHRTSSEFYLREKSHFYGLYH